MPLAAGTRLTHFEVVAPIGAGGMGEVYRARDLELGRDVALKVLAEGFAHDGDRLKRFAREARATAALNHPNILTVFEVDSSADTLFVVFELLTGQTLRLAINGPLGVSRAIDYITQIAHGLAAAHERGIVHRDIKPDNLFITSDGRLKILDFGIAAYAGGESTSAPESALTAPHVMIGTAGYLAPEQARGEPVDARADIFALGAVAYEMFTGHRAFPGRAAEAIAAILKDDPPALADVQPGVPEGIARIVHRCLERRPDQRYQAARDVAFALEAVTAPTVATTSRTTWPRWAPYVAGALVAGLSGIIAAKLVPPVSPPASTLRRAVITTPVSAHLTPSDFVPFALSPDGATLAYVTVQPERMFIRRLDAFEVTPITGTDGAYDPFFSPDNLWLGFWAHGQIKKVPVAGGPAVVICASPDMYGAAWAPDGTIVFSPGIGAGLQTVSAAGGTPQALTALDPGRGELLHGFPQYVNDGRAVLFTATSRSNDEPFAVELFDVESRTRRTVVPGAQYGRYLPTGHVIYVRDRKLFAVKVASGTLAPVGTPQMVVEDVQVGLSGEAHFAVAADGTFAYFPYQPARSRRVVWVDRAGGVTDTGMPPRPYQTPRISPKGDLVAVTIRDAASDDVWTARPGRSTLERLTFGRRALFAFSGMAFHREGTHLAYAEDHRMGVRVVTHAVDGSQPAQELFTWARRIAPAAITRAGDMLLSDFGATNGADILTRSADARATPTMFVGDATNQWGPVLSPDERYVAYASEETGRYEVFVQPFPGPGPKRQLTTEGGSEVTWSRDGREIFFRVSGRMMAIPVVTTPSFQAGRPRQLFEGQFVPGAAGMPNYDVGPDGRFLMMRDDAVPEARDLRIVSNWFADLVRRVP